LHRRNAIACLASVCARLIQAVAGHEEIEAALGDPKVDAIALATPRARHREARNSRDRRRQARAGGEAAGGDFQRRRRSLRARVTRRRLPDDRPHLSLHRLGGKAASRCARAATRQGLLHRLRGVNLGLFQESNVVWDLAPHDVSIINYVLDELPLSVALQLGACVHAKTPDVAFLTMCTPRCLAHVHLSLALAGQSAAHDESPEV